MEKEALRLGASTSFSAVQAAQGMEQLARAGFSAKDSISALGSTLKLAEADSINLASASSIVANTIGQFELKAKDAGLVADVLAFASKNSNTNVILLGESLKIAGRASKSAGNDIQTTVGILGLLANVGLKGTMSGTALKNAIVQITKQGKELRELFGGKSGLTRVLTDSSGKMRSMDFVMFKIIDRLKKVKNEANRNRLAFKILGLRGAGAMEALMAAKPERIQKLLKGIRTESKGTAAAMAKMRLDNLAGDVTIFKSALEGASIGIGKMLIQSLNLREGVKGLTAGIQNTANAAQAMNEGMSKTDVAEKFGATTAAAVFGMKTAAQATGAFLSKFFMAIGGMVKPLIPIFKSVFLAVFKTLKSLVPIGKSVFGFMVAVAKFLLPIIKMVLAGVRSVAKFLTPIIQDMIGFLTKFLIAVKPAVISILTSIGVVWNALKPALKALWDLLKPIFPHMIKVIAIIWKGFAIVLKIGAAIIKKIMPAVTTAFKLISKAIKAIMKIFAPVLGAAWDFVMSQLKVMLGIANKIKDALGLGEKGKIRKFIESEETLAGGLTPGVKEIEKALVGGVPLVAKPSPMAAIPSIAGAFGGFVTPMPKPTEVKSLAFQQDTAKGLKDLNSKFAAFAAKKQPPIVVKTILDGKTIATTTATTVQDTNERSGKPTSPGARRRALETGRM